ncbi:hypothetical protein CF642_37930, partial [Burkholderia pseudomallei]
MAGGAFGLVLGMARGGAVATQLGWRAAFGAMACRGFALVVCVRLVVTERRIAGSGARAPLPAMRRSVTTSRTQTTSAKPRHAIAPNAARQPSCVATAPPRAMPSTKPNAPPATTLAPLHMRHIQRTSSLRSQVTRRHTQKTAQR